MSLDRKTYFALMSLSTAYFTLGVGSLAVVAVMQPMAASLNASVAAIANLLTVFALTFAVSAPLAQVVLGHLPRRTLLLAGLVLMSVSAAVGALSSAYWLVFLSRVVMGVGAALVGPMSSAIGAGLVGPEQQGRALSIVFSGMMLSTVLGVPLSAWLGELFGWRVVFLVIAAVALVAVGAVAALVHDSSRSPRVNLQGLLGVVARRRSGLSLATTLLQMASQFTTYAVITPYLAERFGATAGWVVGALLVFGIGGLVGNLLAGRLADRIGAYRTVGLSLLGTGAAYVALMVAPQSIAFGLPLFALWAVTGTLFPAPQQKCLVEIDPAARSLLLASNASALYLGMSIGSFLAGLVRTEFGVAALPMASLLLMALAGVAFYGARGPAVALPAPPDRGAT